jgi:hypothetical protein
MSRPASTRWGQMKSELPSGIKYLPDPHRCPSLDPLFKKGLLPVRLLSRSFIPRKIRSLVPMPVSKVHKTRPAPSRTGLKRAAGE